MAQLNIKISAEQHRQLKTLASYSGLTMKEFVLSRLLVEAAETIFQNRHEPAVEDKRLQDMQTQFFDKSHIIITTDEHYQKFLAKFSA
jgi:uncharacterized protein (DUF1778 family)